MTPIQAGGSRQSLGPGLNRDCALPPVKVALVRGAVDGVAGVGMRQSDRWLGFGHAEDLPRDLAIQIRCPLRQAGMARIQGAKSWIAGRDDDPNVLGANVS